MIASFTDLCTYIYVLIDDLYQAVIAPHDWRPGPRSACSEGEIITLTLVAELTGQDEEGSFLAYLRRTHPTLFPLLPERTRYNRRRRRLTEVTNRRALVSCAAVDAPAGAMAASLRHFSTVSRPVARPVQARIVRSHHSSIGADHTARALSPFGRAGAALDL